MAGNSMFKNEGKVLTVSWLRVFVGGGVKQADQVRCKRCCENLSGKTVCTDSMNSCLEN